MNSFVPVSVPIGCRKSCETLLQERFPLSEFHRLLHIRQSCSKMMELDYTPVAKKVINHDVNCNNVKPPFKNRKSFLNRREEVEAIRNRFPTKIPIIVERYYKEKSLPMLDKTKFLVPQEITISQFLIIIRNRMKISQTQALYLLIDNRSMLSMSQTMTQAYNDFAHEDGFLYITYASQEVFGGTTSASCKSFTL